MKLIVGLGNPGKRYEGTRHNLGFLIVDRIAKQTGIAFDKESHMALVGSGGIDGEDIVLAKPQTYMNHSGASVAGLLHEWGLTPDHLIVINDDLDLPFGRVRIRPTGSTGGHGGLRSVSESLSGAPFCRVRVGIGRPPPDMDAAAYVLERFTTVELERLSEIVEHGAASVLCLVREGLDRAMANYNRAS